MGLQIQDRRSHARLECNPNHVNRSISFLHHTWFFKMPESIEEMGVSCGVKANPKLSSTSFSHENTNAPIILGDTRLHLSHSVTHLTALPDIQSHPFALLTDPESRTKVKRIILSISRSQSIRSSSYC